MSSSEFYRLIRVRSIHNIGNFLSILLKFWEWRSSKPCTLHFFFLHWLLNLNYYNHIYIRM